MNDKTQSPSVLQLLNLTNDIGRVTCYYLISSGLTQERFDQINNSHIDQIACKNAHDILRLVPDEIMQAKQQLENYFLEIFNLKIDLSKIVFPQQPGFSTFMAVPPKLDEDQIMAAFTEKWGINVYKYLKPMANGIDRDKEQKRPKGLYVFSHRGGDEPDKQHLGKSYDDAIKAGFQFINAREYLLITGFHKYSKGYFMDKKGWTRTSSLWADGGLVIGGWGEASSRLSLFSGNRDDCLPSSGPRELFLA